MPARQRRGPFRCQFPDLRWMNACGSCTWLLLKLKSMSAGMLLFVWPVCFPPRGSLALTAVPLSQCGKAALRVHCHEQIFSQQLSRWRLPGNKTRSSTAASPTRRVLVMLHAGFLHPFAACPMGGHRGCYTKNGSIEGGYRQLCYVVVRQTVA